MSTHVEPPPATGSAPSWRQPIDADLATLTRRREQWARLPVASNFSSNTSASCAGVPAIVVS